MRPNRKEPIRLLSGSGAINRPHDGLLQFFCQGIASNVQHWHNCPANRTEPLPKEGRAVKRPLRKADVAGAWAGLNGAQSRAETAGLGV